MVPSFSLIFFEELNEGHIYITNVVTKHIIAMMNNILAMVFAVDLTFLFA